MEFEDAAAGPSGDTVLELLDRVLNTGVVLAGEIAITVADIELIYLRLQLLLSSAETARQAGWLPPGPHFGKTTSVSAGKGDRHLLPGPTFGCFAQKEPVPFPGPVEGVMDRKAPMAHWDTLFSDNPPTPGPLPAAAVRSRAPSQFRVDPENVSSGLVQLVLTLVELLRELLERQALKRIEGGSLSEEEIERLGLTFLRLAEEMQRLKRQFGLTDDDLNLDLGPLGRLR